MKIIRMNQLDTARSLKLGDTAIIEFDEYRKFKSFTVQLSYYNNGLAKERNLYIHAASKSRKLQYYLLAVSCEDKEQEERNSNLKGAWKKKLPEEWLRG